MTRRALHKILRNTRYLTFIGVLFSLISSAALFLKGASKTVRTVAKVISSGETTFDPEVAMVRIMDNFLVATGLLVFGLGLYELFIGPLALPKALTFRNLRELKTSLANIIVLVLAVNFLEKLEAGQDADAILKEGIAIAFVSAVLIAFRFAGESQDSLEHKGDIEILKR